MHDKREREMMLDTHLWQSIAPRAEPFSCNVCGRQQVTIKFAYTNSVSVMYQMVVSHYKLQSRRVKFEEMHSHMKQEHARSIPPTEINGTTENGGKNRDTEHPTKF